MVLRNLASTLLVLGSALAHAAPGEVDATFGSGGYDTAALPAACVPDVVCWIKSSSVAVQPDGRIVIASNFRYRISGQLSDNQMVLYRRLPNGGPDPAFGSNGIVIPFPVACVGAIVLQSDGKILAGVNFHTFEGSCFTSAGVPHAFGLARFRPDGTTDPTFGVNGIASVDGGIHAVALQSDGRIVVLTRGEGAVSDTAFLKRFNADGTPDLSFGTGGSVDLGIVPEYIFNDELPLTQSYSVALALGTDDRPVVAATSNGKLVVTRSTREGLADTTFNATGRLEFEVGTALTLSTSIGNGAIGFQSTGRILVSGASGNSTGYIFGIRPDGTPDLMFGLGGRAPPPTMPNSPPVPGAIVIQADDRIFAAGYYGVQRLSVDGWRDATFRQSALTTRPRLRVAAQGDDVLVLAQNSVGLELRRHQAGDQYDVFSNARFFAMAQYRDFLDREGDSGGTDFWSQAIASGSVSRAQLAEMFFDSAEFQGTIAPVARLYFAYFLRIPDFAGLNFWIGQFRAGNSLESISNLFATSPEFVKRYGALTNAQFVSLVYQNVLGRAPDTTGLTYWTGRVDGGMTRGQMMVAFSESPEYRATINSEVYVTMMYMGMLRREPDAGGFNFWTGYVDAGNSGIALISGFLASAEYRRRFLP